jgi:hypothetical protein
MLTNIYNRNLLTLELDKPRLSEWDSSTSNKPVEKEINLGGLKMKSMF